MQQFDQQAPALRDNLLRLDSRYYPAIESLLDVVGETQRLGSAAGNPGLPDQAGSPEQAKAGVVPDTH